MQEEDFLREIRRHPDDVSVRLIFADWLDEQGDLQAEFIRIQCELEQIARAETSESNADPGTDTAGRSNVTTLQAREQQLLDTLTPICLEDLQTLAVRDVRFTGGFVADLLVEGERFLQHGRLLARWAPALRTLRWQKLPRTPGPAVTTLLRSPFLSCLRTLDLTGNPVGRAGMTALSAARRLNQIEHLWLADTFLAGQGMQELARSAYLGGLKTLRLGGNDLSAHDLQALSGARTFAQLSELDLSRNRIGDRGLQLLAYAESLKTLRTLNVRQNDVGVLGLRAIADSPILTDLEAFDISGNEFGSAGLQYLASAANYGRLRELHLAECDLQSSDITALTQSPYLKRLHTLELSGNRLREAIGPLSTSPNFQQLTTLGLRRADLDNISARALLEDDAWPHLTSLDLRDNRLIDRRTREQLQDRFGNGVQL